MTEDAEIGSAGIDNSSEPLHFVGIVDAARMLRERAVSARQMTATMLDRIGALNGSLNAYVHVCADRAMEQAARCDREFAAGLVRSPLHGVPIGVKDLCHTTFAPTSAGTIVHTGFIAPRNAAVVDRLEGAGAITLGKLTMTEGAYGLHHPHQPMPVNPWSARHWTGVSSSGSGVATAAALCFGAIGTDTGGSIRFPCAANNLTGVKPTWGRVSRRGTFALAETLDHIGPIARSAADCAMMLSVIAGWDPGDPTAIDAPVPDYAAACTGRLDGVRIGFDRDYALSTTDPAVAAALDDAMTVLCDLGARIVDVVMPPCDDLAASWSLLCGVEAAVAHASTFANRRDDYGPALRHLLEEADRTSPIDIARGTMRRFEFTAALATMFGGVDLLLIPTMPMRIPTLTEMNERGADPLWTANLLKFTAPFDFSGTPTVTLPNGIDADGLPLSMQLAGPRLSEAVLLHAAHAFQTRTDWHLRHPGACRPDRRSS